MDELGNKSQEASESEAIVTISDTQVKKMLSQFVQANTHWIFVLPRENRKMVSYIEKEFAGHEELKGTLKGPVRIVLEGTPFGRLFLILLPKAIVGVDAVCELIRVLLMDVGHITVNMSKSKVKDVYDNGGHLFILPMDCTPVMLPVVDMWLSEYEDAAETEVKTTSTKGDLSVN